MMYGIATALHGDVRWMVFHALCCHLPRVKPGKGRIERITGLSTSSVKRARKALKRVGLIDFDEAHVGGNSPPIYTIADVRVKSIATQIVARIKQEEGGHHEPPASRTLYRGCQEFLTEGGHGEPPTGFMVNPQGGHSEPSRGVIVNPKELKPRAEGSAQGEEQIAGETPPNPPPVATLQVPAASLSIQPQPQRSTAGNPNPAKPQHVPPAWNESFIADTGLPAGSPPAEGPALPAARNNRFPSLDKMPPIVVKAAAWTPAADTSTPDPAARAKWEAFTKQVA
jgi:hypothetical protein